MKTQINNLKDYAELAWASYFYFDFLNTRNIFELDFNQEKNSRRKILLEAIEK
ncbi:hypothetical protein B6765_000685 (plasmid) [Campylobacter coli]